MGVHGHGQQSPNPTQSTYPGLDLKIYYLGRAWIMYLGMFSKWTGLGLIGRL